MRPEDGGAFSSNPHDRPMDRSPRKQDTETYTIPVYRTARNSRGSSPALERAQRWSFLTTTSACLGVTRPNDYEHEHIYAEANVGTRSAYVDLDIGSGKERAKELLARAAPCSARVLPEHPGPAIAWVNDRRARR